MKFGAVNLRRLSPVARLAPFLVGNSSPTASLYFENACADWLKDGRIKKIAPTVFASKTVQLVFRHDTGVPIGFSRPKTVYFIDDDWHPNPDLPWKYRFKSKMVEQRAARFFMPRADILGLSSARLAAQAHRVCRAATIKTVQPYWSEPLAGWDHFGQPSLKICYLGARSHALDLLIIFPAIRAVLDRFQTARFTISAQHALPRDLANHPRVDQFPEMGWQEYRQMIVAQRFHIALYPLRPTAFNFARSDNKLIEHAVVGAATICSDHWKNGSKRVVSVPDDADDWTQALCNLAADRDQQIRIARANKDIVAQENRPDAQRALWRDLLFPK